MLKGSEEKVHGGLNLQANNALGGEGASEMDRKVQESHTSSIEEGMITKNVTVRTESKNL